MSQLEVKQNFRYNDKLYEKDKRYDVQEFNVDTILKLNEKGYIKTLKHAELVQIEKELKGDIKDFKSKNNAISSEI